MTGKDFQFAAAIIVEPLDAPLTGCAAIFGKLWRVQRRVRSSLSCCLALRPALASVPLSAAAVSTSIRWMGHFRS
jgi:hypothetical protein